MLRLTVAGGPENGETVSERKTPVMHAFALGENGPPRAVTLATRPLDENVTSATPAPPP